MEKAAFGRHMDGVIEDIDINDAGEFEALMLRLWARHVRFQCWLSEQPDPPDA